VKASAVLSIIFNKQKIGHDGLGKRAVFSSIGMIGENLIQRCFFSLCILCDSHYNNEGKSEGCV